MRCGPRPARISGLLQIPGNVVMPYCVVPLQFEQREKPLRLTLSFLQCNLAANTGRNVRGWALVWRVRWSQRKCCFMPCPRCKCSLCMLLGLCTDAHTRNSATQHTRAGRASACSLTLNAHDQRYEYARASLMMGHGRRESDHISTIACKHLRRALRRCL